MFSKALKTIILGCAAPRQAKTFTPLFKRCYASQRATGETGPKFRYLFLIGIVSYGMLSLAVEGVDKRKPKNNFTEEEYAKYEIQEGIKRKTKMFKDALKVKVYLLPYDFQVSSMDLENLDKDIKVIKLSDAINAQKEDKNSQYGALIIEYQRLNKSLPSGTESFIIGNEISKLEKEKLNKEEPGKYLVLGFPKSIDESIKFEDKISIVDKLINFKNDNEDLDVVRYFKTVNKTVSIDDMKKLDDILKQ